MEVCKWNKEKNHRFQDELQCLEVVIESLFQKRLLGSLFKEDCSLIHSVEERKSKILLKEEELWILKSRAI